jgi:hypothetical protein
MRDVLICSRVSLAPGYGASHPFKPMRAKLFELLHRFNLCDGDNLKDRRANSRRRLLCLFQTGGT